MKYRFACYAEIVVRIFGRHCTDIAHCEHSGITRINLENTNLDSFVDFMNNKFGMTLER